MNDLPKLRQSVVESGPESPEPPPLTAHRRRIGPDTINDLIFWGIHLCVVAVALSIVWYKIDRLSGAIKSLLDAQAQENVLVRRQVASVEEQTTLVKAQEQQRGEQVKANQVALGQMLTSMTQIQADIRKNLEQTQGIAETILEVSTQAKAASLQAVNASTSAAHAANSAASAAGNAANAASSAAARSNATKTLIREKVVTTDDKIRIEREQAALAAKKAQLTKTIKQVKKNGPNLIQQLFH